ncbi:SDR family NAD(P)-dependent oxidoreductase [Terriglobus sp.]|uniref:SDR family NAD(P)-dependent oxidoreductase n=1 Tax=Terriglobus sp. TaxID=1889013 RepID=UPI003AFFD583
MTNQAFTTNASGRNAYIITGPTSGIGLSTALALAAHGTVVLVGRDIEKLNEVQREIERKGGQAVPVPCDMSDIASVRRAANSIVDLQLPLAGLVNNVGIHQTKPTSSAQGWDMTFATNHLGPFALTEALIPHLPDGANVVFVASGVEDPERKPAKMAGFRGGRYISAEASAHGEWEPGGAKTPGADAYATSKQCTLATALEFAREIPRLHFNAVEPGFNPATALGREANGFVRFLLKRVLPLLVPVMKFWSTPSQAAAVITKTLMNASGQTGTYYDDRGLPMLPSALVQDPAFTARVVAETRSFLAQTPN